MINIKEENDEQMKKNICLDIMKYNKKNCDWLKNNYYKPKEHNFFALNGDKCIGGVIGFVDNNWYYLDLLYVNNAYRNKKIGTELINRVEQFSKANNLTGIRMETWDFQAKRFYEKIGYTVFGIIKECPPGTIEYHLMKKISKTENVNNGV